MQLNEYLQHFVNLFYPHLCLACEAQAPVPGDDLCIRCRYKLPATNFHLHPANEFTDRFWGRFPLKAAAAMYYFKKKGLTQQVIYKLKYEGKHSIGLRLGEMYGHQLKNAVSFRDVECIVPVPLHPRKEKLRGYNQSAMISQGLALAMKIPVYPRALKRLLHTSTQTKKGILERLDNVQSVFAVAQGSKLKGRHVLLVDDVLTTGATLEACALQVLSLPGTTVSLVTLAMAKI